MVLFNNILYKRMRLTNKVNLTKTFLQKILAHAPNNQTSRYFNNLQTTYVHMYVPYQ